MISTRYLIPTLILLALALIPTTIHNYIGAIINDGKSVNNIPFTLNQFTSTPSKRNSQWGKDIFGSEDWFERNYQDKLHNKVRLFVARSYDHKRLYHHPELALSYGHSLNTMETLNLPNHPEIPVHILNKDDGSMRIAYILLYGNNFIDDPILHQLSDSIRLLMSPRKPMTLFYASQIGSLTNEPLNQSPIISILSLAIKNFQSQSSPSL
ncbi:MAG: hypothetical protein GQ532_05470 [Methylomarinum sp.]|nr:hypothetical protein [Methylomarinum sp.]